MNNKQYTYIFIPFQSGLMSNHIFEKRLKSIDDSNENKSLTKSECTSYIKYTDVCIYTMSESVESIPTEENIAIRHQL